jgi:hypothetical protein
MWNDVSVSSRKRNPKRQCNRETEKNFDLFVFVAILIVGFEVFLSAFHRCVSIATFIQYCIITIHLWEFYYFIINNEDHSYILTLVNTNVAIYALLILRYFGGNKTE